MTDNWNLIGYDRSDDVTAPDDDWHPAMRRQPDPTVDPRAIHHRSPRVQSVQERLLAELNQVRLVSKTEATVGGVTVTLNPATGWLTCSSPTCPKRACRHVIAVKNQALRRRPR